MKSVFRRRNRTKPVLFRTHLADFRSIPAGAARTESFRLSRSRLIRRTLDQNAQPNLFISALPCEPDKACAFQDASGGIETNPRGRWPHRILQTVPLQTHPADFRSKCAAKPIYIGIAV